MEHKQFILINEVIPQIINIADIAAINQLNKKFHIETKIILQRLDLAKHITFLKFHINLVKDQVKDQHNKSFYVNDVICYNKKCTKYSIFTEHIPNRFKKLIKYIIRNKDNVIHLSILFDHMIPFKFYMKFIDDLFTNTEINIENFKKAITISNIFLDLSKVCKMRISYPIDKLYINKIVKILLEKHTGYLYKRSKNYDTFGIYYMYAEKKEDIFGDLHEYK